MQALGFFQLGLVTRDMDATLAFYTEALGFEAVRFDILKVAEGGEIRHVFLDAGAGRG